MLEVLKRVVRGHHVVHHPHVDRILLVLFHCFLHRAHNPLRPVLEGAAADRRQKELDASLALHGEQRGDGERGLVLGVEHRARERLPLLLPRHPVVGHRHR
eukprot:1716835-Rhodomonas_salina.1